MRRLKKEKLARSAGWCGDNLNDGREARRLAVSLRIHVAGTAVPRVVLDRHSRRKRHRLFSEAPDFEYMRGGRVEHKGPSGFQRALVILHQFGEAQLASEQVVALAAAGIVRRDELRVRVHGKSELEFGRYTVRRSGGCRGGRGRKHRSRGDGLRGR